jgi:hypothetical protein
MIILRFHGEIKEFTALAGGQQMRTEQTELSQLGGRALHCAVRCNLILPVNSKQSRLPNPRVRGGMATPVGATGSKVRPAIRPEPRNLESLVSALFGV